MLKFSFSPFSLRFVTSTLGAGEKKNQTQNRHHHHYYSSYLAGCDLGLSQPTKVPNWFLFRSKSKEECTFIGIAFCKNEIFPKEKVLFYDYKPHKIKLLNPDPSLQGSCAQHPSTSRTCTPDFFKIWGRSACFMPAWKHVAIVSLCSGGRVSVQGLLHTELIAVRINGTSLISLAYQGV